MFNMESIDKEICGRLIEVRKKLDLTQVTMAEKADLSRSFIANIESGKQNPSYDFLMKISATFNISLDWLLFGRGQMFILPEDHYLNNLSSKQLEFLAAFASLPADKQTDLLKAFLEIMRIVE